MVAIQLTFGDYCSVHVEARVPWSPLRQTALVDTGLVREGCGLILPAPLAPESVKGSIWLKVGDGRKVPARYAPNGTIVRIGNHRLVAPVQTGVAFLGDQALLGMDVIRRGVLRVDGPNRSASLELV